MARKQRLSIGGLTLRSPNVRAHTHTYGILGQRPDDGLPEEWVTYMDGPDADGADPAPGT